MEEEIELRELIEILLKRKWTIVICTLGAILLTVVYSFVILDPTYEVEMVVMASSNPGVEIVHDNNTVFMVSNQEDQGYRFNSSNIDAILNDMSKGSETNIETYKRVIKSPDLLSKILVDLNLEDKYSINSLANMINIDMIKDTQLISIKMEGSDPVEAAEIVNSLGDNFLTTIISQKEEKEDNVFKYVESQIEVEKKKYEDALSELKDSISKPRSAKEVKLELESNFAQITDYKAKLNDLEVKSQGQIENIKSKIDHIGKDIQNLQLEYQDREYAESILRQKRDMAKETYGYFLSKNEELRLIQSIKDEESNITIISRANSSNPPIGPRKSLNLAIGSVLGLMIGVFLAFFKEYWQTSSKENTVDGGKIG